MVLCIQTNLFIQRFILSQSLPDVGDFDAQVELLEGEGIEVELALLCLDLFLLDSFTEELTWVQELLEQESSQLL